MDEGGKSYTQGGVDGSEVDFRYRSGEVGWLMKHREGPKLDVLGAFKQRGQQIPKYCADRGENRPPPIQTLFCQTNKFPSHRSGCTLEEGNCTEQRVLLAE